MSCKSADLAVLKRGVMGVLLFCRLQRSHTMPDQLVVLPLSQPGALLIIQKAGRTHKWCPPPSALCECKRALRFQLPFVSAPEHVI